MIEFNLRTIEPPYFKFIKLDKCHNKMTYKLGLNVDIMPFDPSGECKKEVCILLMLDIFMNLLVTVQYYVRLHYAKILKFGMKKIINRKLINYNNCNV